MPDVKIEPHIPLQPQVKVEEKPLSRAKAIQVCQEKYPGDFKRKKVITLAIAIGSIALFVIPALAMLLTAVSACTFEVGLLVIAPIAILAITILIKKIDRRTLYWSGDLARILIKKKEEEVRKALDKTKGVEVKSKKSGTS